MGNITMKSKIMVANTCQTCDGKGRLPDVTEQVHDELPLCSACNGEGVTYEWTTLDTIITDVERIMYKSLRFRQGVYF